MHRKPMLRVFVTLATLVVVWLVAPARAQAAMTAAAPVCDPRGAIGFAPPPQMQDPQQSLDIVVNEDDCTQSPLETRHVVPNRTAPQFGCCSMPDPANSTYETVAVAEGGAGERLLAPVASASCSRPGFRVDFERPPRV